MWVWNLDDDSDAFFTCGLRDGIIDGVCEETGASNDSIVSDVELSAIEVDANV